MHLAFSNEHHSRQPTSLLVTELQWSTVSNGQCDFLPTSGKVKIMKAVGVEDTPRTSTKSFDGFVYFQL